MQVEDERLPAAFKLPEHPLRVEQRKNPQIASACRGQVHARDSYSCRGEFQQAPSIVAGVLVGITARIRDSVKIMMNGINAGIVLEAFFRKHIERPERPACNRPSGGAIACHADARRLLDRVTGRASIKAKFLWGKRIDPVMPEAVTGQFVSSLVDLTHDFRKMPGNPSRHKERGFDAIQLKNIEQEATISCYTAGKLAP